MNPPKKQTILIVDDMRTNALAMAAMLKSEWNVITALDGETALKMAVEKPAPNLILLDINMPGMDGYEVCRRVKASQETCDIPVIFVTAKDDPKEEAYGLELGAVDYIMKPVNATIVKARLRNHLSLQLALSELAVKNEELAFLAAMDKLTGLYNRRKLDELLAVEVARAERYNRPLSIILLDIDRFKSINDTHGHLVGDTVLIETAGRLKNAIRSCDIAGRWGGDEFLIICPETASATALLLGIRLRYSYEALPFPTAGTLTACFGTSSWRKGLLMDNLLSDADKALYRAKTGGRNQVEQETS